MPKIDFRIELVKLMDEKKISVAKLSRLADLNYGTLFYFLSGKSQMTAANLEKVFNILKEIEKPVTELKG